MQRVYTHSPAHGHFENGHRARAKYLLKSNKLYLNACVCVCVYWSSPGTHISSYVLLTHSRTFKYGDTHGYVCVCVCAISIKIDYVPILLFLLPLLCVCVCSASIGGRLRVCEIIVAVAGCEMDAHGRTTRRMRVSCVCRSLRSVCPCPGAVIDCRGGSRTRAVFHASGARAAFGHEGREQTVWGRSVEHVFDCIISSIHSALREREHYTLCV